MEQDSPIISRCGVKYSPAIILWTLLDAFNKSSIQSATEYFIFFDRSSVNDAAVTASSG